MSKNPNKKTETCSAAAETLPIDVKAVSSRFWPLVEAAQKWRENGPSSKGVGKMLEDNLVDTIDNLKKQLWADIEAAKAIDEAAERAQPPCRDAADKERYALKAGDVVTLKSGGPLMTVSGHREVRDADGKLLPYEVVACIWFGGESFDHPNHRDFRADTLLVR